MSQGNATLVFTIGHSTRPLVDFVAMLEGHGVRHLLDVRSIPRSRHNPQFNQENLPSALAEAGIDYAHMEGLGGFRRALPETTNAGWRNASFRGYADYMRTPAFAENLEALIALAEEKPVAVMCAEAVPWRCHRSLIADALTVRGIATREIVDARRSQLHKLTPFAEVEGTMLSYPPSEAPAS